MANLPSFTPTICFSSSATLAYPEKDSEYCFIAVLGLIQRLKIDLLPLMWQDSLGLVGQSRAKISQATVNIQTSFAFKRFDHTDQSDPFQEIVQEMVILCHPIVQNHPHLVQLIGICWDIPQDDQVWPVLVFEKSQLGDLYHFARFGKGKDLSLEDKLDICTSVGIAIRDMHLNNIIHGDIKPQNVLMFEDKPSIYTAKVADFGFSTHFHGENDLVNMPESVPWNAPERHHRGFFPQDAKAMDVYSFGMLCLWLLFGVNPPKPMQYPLGAASDARIFSFEAQDWFQKRGLLLSWKEDALLESAIQLVTEDGRFVSEQRNNLIQFFRSSLHPVPQKRITDWDRLSSFLIPLRGIPSTKVFSEKLAQKVEDFQIASSILELYNLDFRLRFFITAQLEDIVSASTTPTYKRILITNAIEQRDLCYEIGFGTQGDKSQKEILTVERSQRNAIQDQVQLIKDGMRLLYNRTGPLAKCLESGFILSYLPDYYRERNLTTTAIEVYKIEITEIEKVFGSAHSLNSVLRTHLAGVFSSEGKWKDAEELMVRALEDVEKALGREHHNTLAIVDNLASVLRDQGKYEEAKEMNWRALEGRENALGKDHPNTLGSVINLALVLQNQGKYQEAEEMSRRALEGREKALGKDHPDTLNSVSNLASVLICQGNYKEAEEMSRRALEGIEKALGKDHPDTLISVSNLALVLRNQGKYKEAEEMNRRALKGIEKALGKDHSNTLTSVSNLASVLQDQGKYEEAEERKRQVLKGTEKALGKDHPETLVGVSNLASLLAQQQQYKAALALYESASSGFERILGPDHPYTLSCSRDYLSLKHEMQKIQEGQEKEEGEEGEEGEEVEEEEEVREMPDS